MKRISAVVIVVVLEALSAVWLASCHRAQQGDTQEAAQPPRSQNVPPLAGRSWEEVDRDVAAQFAPEFYQGLIGSERFDYITNFDFDGDWHGDNNWEHAADRRYPQKAYVYYAVSETPTHYFVHYAAFHPRDWKGGERTGRLLSSTIQESTTVGGTIRARGLMGDLVLSHENDLEGCLVVVEKRGGDLAAARVVLVETMAHNQYLRFAFEPESAAIKPLRLDGQHPLLYVEAQGHGIEAFRDQPLRKPDADGTVSPRHVDVESNPESDETEASADAQTPDGAQNPAISEDPNAPKPGRFARMKRVTRF